MPVSANDCYTLHHELIAKARQMIAAPLFERREITDASGARVVFMPRDDWKPGDAARYLNTAMKLAERARALEEKTPPPPLTRAVPLAQRKVEARQRLAQGWDVDRVAHWAALTRNQVLAVLARMNHDNDIDTRLRMRTVARRCLASMQERMPADPIRASAGLERLARVFTLLGDIAPTDDHNAGGHTSPGWFPLTPNIAGVRMVAGRDDARQHTTDEEARLNVS